MRQCLYVACTVFQVVVGIACMLPIVASVAKADDGRDWKKMSSLVGATEAPSDKKCKQLLADIKTLRDGACTQAVFADTSTLLALTKSPFICGNPNGNEKTQYKDILASLLDAAEFGSAWGAAYSLDIMSVFGLADADKVEKALYFLENNKRPKIALEVTRNFNRHIVSDAAWSAFKQKIILETGSLEFLAKHRKAVTAPSSGKTPSKAEFERIMTGALGENVFFGKMFVGGDGC